MNLSFTRGDDEAAVRENYHRIAKSIGVKCENMVLSQQTHTTNVRVVTEKKKTKGRDSETIGLYRCGWNGYKYPRNLPCDILCRLCSVIFRRSGSKKGNRT